MKMLVSDWKFYLKTGIFGLVIFGLCYGYLKYLGIPGELNKSAADTAVVLMGLSMLLSSICYFWNSFDWAIIYRKYLGLIGFAFAIAHLLLTWEVFLSLTKLSTWQEGLSSPVVNGGLAIFIFWPDPE